jgi:hypothetical protein
MFNRLDAIVARYAHFTMRYSGQRLPSTSQEAITFIKQNAAEFFVTNFRGARMIPKRSFLRDTAGTVVAAAAVYANDRLGVTDRLAQPVNSVVSTVTSHAQSVATTVASTRTAQSAQQFIQMIIDYIKSTAVTVADSGFIQDVVSALGVGYHFFQNLLTHVAATVGKAVYDVLGGAIIGSIGEAVAAFYKALKAHMAERAGIRARYAVAGGTALDAYNTIVNFWTEEKRENLKAGTMALAEALVRGVAAAAGGVAGHVIVGVATAAKKAYEAASKVWETVKKIVDTIKEITEVNETLRSLTVSGHINTAELFEKSPLLATYYIMSLPTSGLVALDMTTMALSGFMDTVKRLQDMLEPVRDKAAEYIAESKFMFICASGKPPPVRTAIGDASLMEQIKERIKDAVGDLLPDPSELAEDFAGEQLEAFVAPAREAMGIPAEAAD